MIFEAFIILTLNVILISNIKIITPCKNDHSHHSKYREECLSLPLTFTSRCNPPGPPSKLSKPMILYKHIEVNLSSNMPPNIQ